MQRTIGLDNVIRPDVVRMIGKGRTQSVSDQQRQSHYEPEAHSRSFKRKLFRGNVEVRNDERRYNRQQPRNTVVLDHPKILPHKRERINEDQQVAQLEASEQAFLTAIEVANQIRFLMKL